MSATKREEAILNHFPAVKLKEHGERVKFTISHLESIDVAKIAILHEHYPIEIKRSGKGLVVIVD